jgi:TPR repeat protein
LIKNIFCKDIEIQFVEEIDLTDTRYYLSIAAPRGNSVSSVNATVDLVGQLVYQGESILEAQQEKCTF